MLKIHRAATAIALVAALLVAQPAHGSGRGPCSQDRYDVKPRMGHEVVAGKVRALIRCAVDRFGPVSGGVPKVIAVGDCESSLWPWARNGSYLGLFQHSARYWPARVRGYLDRTWFTDHQWERILRLEAGAAAPTAPMLARANVFVSVRMARAHGWGPWPGCA